MKKTDYILGTFLFLVFFGATVYLFDYYLNVDGIVAGKKYIPGRYVSDSPIPDFSMNPQTGETEFRGMRDNPGVYRIADQFQIIIKTTNKRGKPINKYFSISEKDWNQVQIGDSVIQSKIKIK